MKLFPPVLLLVWLCGFTFVLGLCCENWKGFEERVSLVEILSLFVTLVLGTVYPFVLKRLIDDQSELKNKLSNELDILSSYSFKVKDVFDKCIVENRNITSSEKKFVTLQFEEIDLQIDALLEMVHVAYPTHHPSISQTVKEANRQFWEFTTSEKIMRDAFILDEDFNVDFSREWKRFHNTIKSVSLKIHTF